MHTLGDMAKALNRTGAYLHGIQARFDLPVFEGASYSDAYFAFLKNVVYLRILNVSEESLRDLWRVEKKLLQLLHLDSPNSRTWFLDNCGQTTRRHRRLLLSNADIGVTLPSETVQLGLNFKSELPEFFDGREMGEDVIRVLKKYLGLYGRILGQIQNEVPVIRDAVRFNARFG